MPKMVALNLHSLMFKYRNTTTGWYYDDVAIAQKAGYISGYPDGTFKPNKTMTRGELAYALGQLVWCELVNQVGGVVGTVDNTVDTALGLVPLMVCSSTLNQLLSWSFKSWIHYRCS